MARSDQQHFDKYTPQNQIKHDVLGKYLGAYVRALSRVAAAFHYIDGFAGPGLYEGKYPGSPLIALKLLASQSLPFSVSFVESDPTLFAELGEALSRHPQIKHMIEEPFVKQGRFEDFVGEILSREIYRRYQKVATFAFVDPCGAKGVRMEDLSALLSQQFGECLLFWNYDGINRWLGAVLKETHDRQGIIELFGSESAASDALAICKADPIDKEQRLRDLFIWAVRERSGARYLLPFRFEAKSSDRTSHYLVHCSGHSLAFKIMKDVMGTASSSDEAGTFEFLSAAESGSLFAPQIDTARADILAHLSHGSAAVRTFTEEWVRRPDDFLRGSDYKRILLELEQSGAIDVWDKTNTRPRSLEKRRRAGKPTLGDDCVLRIRK